jgi:hypothetical protein
MIDALFDCRVGFEPIGNMIDGESEAAVILSPVSRRSPFILTSISDEIGSAAFWQGRLWLFQQRTSISCRSTSPTRSKLPGSNSNAPTDHSAAGEQALRISRP